MASQRTRLSGPRRHRWTAGLFCALFSAVLVGSAPAKPSLPPMVSVDLELHDWLSRARQRIEKRDFAQAIQILQALMERDSAGFIQAADDPRRYVPLQVLAAGMIGSMPPEGLERYRRLYDPKARQKLQSALETGDLQGLRRVVRRYGHTSVGPRASQVLADWLFDRGQFERAIALWQNQLRQAGKNDKPALLGRLAVASHLAGRKDLAEQTRKELARHPDAEGVLAGQRQNLLKAVRRILARPYRRTEPFPAKQHPGWGSPGGLAPSPTPCLVVLFPRWQYPPDVHRELDGLTLEGSLQYLGRRTQKARPERKAGHVFLHLQVGKKRLIQPLDALLRPLVLDDLVVCRTDDGLLGLDLWTGELRWQADLPLQRDLDAIKQKHSIRHIRFHSSRGLLAVDRGRYALTAGGDRVFTTYHFAPSATMIGAKGQVELSGSQLAALSVPAEGKLLWTLGAGQGQSDLLRQGTYLGPPAWSPGHGGRLYALVLYAESYHLACLRAETGELLWQRELAQTPPLDMRRTGHLLGDLFKTLASPPTVADGRVYLATNTGAVLCLDAATGQPLWARQYPSTYLQTHRPYSPPGNDQFMPSLVNPLVVADGVLACLPADSGELIALDAETGRALWTADRAGANHLTFAGRGRLLLTGSELRVLDLGTGRERYRSAGLDLPAGRPAVADNHALLSGHGILHVVDLDTFTHHDLPLQDPDAILGNLVACDGKLLAANTAGLAAYFRYEDALAEMTRRIEAAQPGQRIELLFQRARLARNTAHFDQALADYDALQQLAESLDAPDRRDALRTRLRPQRYRAFVGRGNQADDLDAMEADFLQARDIARTPQETGHMLLRLARLRERQQQFTRALELAQKLADQLPAERLVDVRIGPDARDRLGRSDIPRATGYELARSFVQRLIELHGQEVYADFDAAARDALDAAIDRDDPDAILAALRRFPHTRYRDEAEFVAAEASYRRSRKAVGQNAQLLLAQAEELLRRVAARRDSPRRLSALVALVALYESNGRDVSARRTRIEIAGTDPGTPIAFADLRGPLGDVLDDLRNGPLQTPNAPELTDVRQIAPPIHPIFHVPGGRLLVDDKGQPVQFGDLLLVQVDDRTLLVDSTAPDFASAVVCEALTGIDARLAYFVAGGNADGQRIAVYGGGQVVAFAADTGKLLWKQRTRPLGIDLVASVSVLPRAILVIGANQTLAALDFDDGSLLWKSTLPPGYARYNDLGCPAWTDGLIFFPRQDKLPAMAFDSDSGKLLYKQALSAHAAVDILPHKDNHLLTARARRVHRITVRDDGSTVNRMLCNHPAVIAPSFLHALSKSVVLRLADNGSKLGLLQTDLPPNAKNTLRVIDLRADVRDRAPRIPQACASDGRDLFVLTTSRPVAKRTERPLAHQPGLVRVNIANGKSRVLVDRLSFEDIAPDAPVTIGQVLLGSEHLVVVLWPGDKRDQARALILDRTDGQRAQRIDRASLVALTHGRLAVQRNDRLTILGAK